MNLNMPQEKLSRLIRQFTSESIESRQVARRLADLLPARFREIKREHLRQDARGAGAERLALTDRRYLDSLDELADVSSQATLARIQYETHVMLYKARQSLRPLRRR